MITRLGERKYVLVKIKTQRHANYHLHDTVLIIAIEIFRHATLANGPTVKSYPTFVLE